MKKEKSCGVLIYNIDRGIKWLVLRHNPDRGHHWDFPKGHVNIGETELETAKREVYEECGLNVDIIKGYREVITYNPKSHVTKDVVFFVERAKNTKVKFILDEMCEYKWLAFNQAHKLLTFKKAKELLAKANKFIIKRTI